MTPLQAVITIKDVRGKSRIIRLLIKSCPVPQDTDPWRRAHLSERFDYIFRRHTGFATLDRLLQRLHANKASENDIRCQVTKNARSVAAPAATSVATAVMPSFAWPRPVPSWVSLSGITSAANSPSRISRTFLPYQTSSAAAAKALSRLHPGCPPFCPCYKGKREARLKRTIADERAATP